MPQDELETIVQRMMDEGENDNAIADVIKEYNKSKTPEPFYSGLNSTPDLSLGPSTRPPLSNIKSSFEEPAPRTTTSIRRSADSQASGDSSDWYRGFADSILNGEALNAGLRGARGYLKGAIADLPSTLARSGQAMKSPIDSMTLPFQMAKSAIFGGSPIDTTDHLTPALRNMWDTTTHAGSNPEAFGEMTGQITGQPLAMEGLAHIPYGKIPTGAIAEHTVAPAGRTIESAGEYIKNKQPVTGLFPPFVAPRTFRNIESAFGAGLEKIGQSMGRFGGNPVVFGKQGEFWGGGSPNVKVSTAPDPVVEPWQPTSDAVSVDIMGGNRQSSTGFDHTLTPLPDEFGVPWTTEPPPRPNVQGPSNTGMNPGDFPLPTQPYPYSVDAPPSGPNIPGPTGTGSNIPGPPEGPTPYGLGAGPQPNIPRPSSTGADLSGFPLPNQPYPNTLNAPPSGLDIPGPTNSGFDPSLSARPSGGPLQQTVTIDPRNPFVKTSGTGYGSSVSLPEGPISWNVPAPADVPAPVTETPTKKGTGSKFEKAMQAKSAETKQKAIIEPNPDNPKVLRGSLDGGETWRYSLDNGASWQTEAELKAGQETGTMGKKKR